jgi:hypothetical protein
VQKTDERTGPAATGADGRPRVARRHVFYISGFDPRGPMHYYRLYREESAKQSAINGLKITAGKRRTIDEFESAWTLVTGTTICEYSFLRYEDIVRIRWPAGAAAMYASILRYTWNFARLGVFAVILRNSWPAFIAVIYPAALLLALFLAAAALGSAVAALGGAIYGAAAYAAGLPALAVPFLLYGLVDRRLSAFWLARSCAFLTDRGTGRAPEIDARCGVFASRIARAVRDGGNDEVLVAGHSVGTHIAITAVARALDSIPDGSWLSLLTAGQSIVMTPDAPLAAQFRQDLLKVATSSKVRWIDVTSAVDGSCIALTDPLATSGIARPAGAMIQPKLVSARFNKLFTPATYAGMRRDFLRTHFQYLMAAELAGDYDYFLITAGDMTLQDRFAHLESVGNFNRFRLGKS